MEDCERSYLELMDAEDGACLEQHADEDLGSDFHLSENRSRSVEDDEWQGMEAGSSWRCQEGQDSNLPEPGSRSAENKERQEKEAGSSWSCQEGQEPNLAEPKSSMGEHCKDQSEEMKTWLKGVDCTSVIPAFEKVSPTCPPVNQFLVNVRNCVPY